MACNNVFFLFISTSSWVYWALPNEEPIEVTRYRLANCKKPLFYVVFRFLFAKLLELDRGNPVLLTFLQLLLLFVYCYF